jgi:pyruvate kinase
MNWGVTAVRFEGEDLSDAAQIAFAVERAVQLGIAEPGDVVVATSGVGRETGSTNLIRVVTVGPARA